jgi:hypothetical protein
MKLGDVFEKSGSTAQALENFRKSLETLEALARAVPANAGIREMLAQAQAKVTKLEGAEDIH